MNGINIKISTPLDNENKSSADTDKEGGIGDGKKKKNGRMRSKASSKLKPPPSSGSPTCQSEYDSMDLTYPCQTLAFDRLYKSHLHALIDDEDEESNSSKSSDKVRLPVHILKDDDSISSISSNYDIHEDSDSGIEAEDIEFSYLLDKVFSFNQSSSQAAAERSDNNTTSASDFLFCQLGCGHPDMYHDEDTDSFNDLDDFIMGEGGEEETGALKLLNDWVQLNDHPGTVAGTVTVTVDEQGQGEGTIHDEGGNKEWGRKVLGVEGQMHFKTADDMLREKDFSLSEDEVPFRVLTITTPSSASGKNIQSQSLRGQKKSTTTDVSATKCCCTIM